MIYLQYLILVPFSLIITLMGLILSPILPLFSKNYDGWLDNQSTYGIGPRLPNWLSWFMTPDNSLDGDYAFDKLNGRSYWSKVKWLCRNPAYSFGLRYVEGKQGTFIGDNTITDNNNAKEGWCFVRAGELFQFRYIKRIFNTDRCILINLGWNVMALVDNNINPKPNPYQATFVFSPRISGFRL